MNLVCCQIAGGLWTGLGWATPVGGQALIRSHGPPRRGWVGSTGHYQDNAGEHVSRFIGSDPTHGFRSCGVGVCRFGGPRNVSGTS